MSDNSDRMKIVIWYAAWATVCAAVAGIAIALAHTWFFSYTPTRAARMSNAPRIFRSIVVHIVTFSISAAELVTSFMSRKS